jgi:hypothetical protein
MKTTGSNHGKIGDAKRSDRNSWAENIEEYIRELCPFPTTYDVGSIQQPRFGEFSYTEFAGGVYLNTMSVEMNCRIVNAAKEYSSKTDIAFEWKRILKDKYELEEVPDRFKEVKRIVMVPGHNMYKVIDWEVFARAAFENDDIFFKFHPVTNPEGEDIVGKLVGWNLVIPRQVSGMQLLLQSEEIWASACSEFTATGVLFGKQVNNYGSIFEETIGAYYALTRELFLLKELKRRQELLYNVIDCDFSGFIFPWQKDWKDRIEAYYDFALYTRKKFAPLAGTYVPVKPVRTTNSPVKPVKP